MAIDVSGAFCNDLIHPDGYAWAVATSGYTYYPTWDASGCQLGYVTVQASTFNALVSAANGASAPSSPSASQFTDAEVTALKFQAANPSPFYLSLEDGALVSVAILAVWGSAAVMKTIRQMFAGGDSVSE